MFKSLSTALTVIVVSGCTPAAPPTNGTAGGPDGASAPVTAAAALDGLVSGQINAFYTDIDDPTNRPQLIMHAPAGVLKSRDINGDGVADWIVTWPESAQFCGTGGCRVTVYLGKGDNLQRVFDRQILGELKINQVGGETRIESVFHHSSCGERRPVCTLAWGLDPATGQLAPRPSANGDVFSSGEKPIDEIWDKAVT